MGVGDSAYPVYVFPLFLCQFERSYHRPVSGFCSGCSGSWRSALFGGALPVIHVESLCIAYPLFNRASAGILWCGLCQSRKMVEEWFHRRHRKLSYLARYWRIMVENYWSMVITKFLYRRSFPYGDSGAGSYYPLCKQCDCEIL